jgi:hypothetical protein
LHCDQVLSRYRVGDCWVVTSTAESLESTSCERSGPWRSVHAEIAAQVRDGARVGDEGMEPFRKRMGKIGQGHHRLQVRQVDRQYSEPLHLFRTGRIG